MKGSSYKPLTVNQISTGEEIILGELLQDIEVEVLTQAPYNWRTEEENLKATIERIEYDPNRTANIVD